MKTPLSGRALSRALLNGGVYDTFLDRGRLLQPDNRELQPVQSFCMRQWDDHLSGRKRAVSLTGVDMIRPASANADKEEAVIVF